MSVSHELTGQLSSCGMLKSSILTAEMHSFDEFERVRLYEMIGKNYSDRIAVRGDKCNHFPRLILSALASGAIGRLPDPVKTEQLGTCWLRWVRSPREDQACRKRSVLIPGGKQ